MKESKKMPVAVYQLDRQEQEDKSFVEFVDHVIYTINNREGNYVEEIINTDVYKEFAIRLFTSCREAQPKWTRFIQPLLNDKSLIPFYENRIHSFICFIGYGDHVFAVTGGAGSFAIDSFVCQNFGLEIITRLFQKDNKVIRGIQERGVTGIILGQTRYYRGDQRFSDESRFGKIFKQVRAELNEKILKKSFGFTGNQLKKASSGCMAKNSFLINKSIDLPTLLVLIKRFAEILKQKENFSLNKVTQLSRRDTRTVDLRKALKDQLVLQLYECCKNGSSTDIDFCHPNFEEYLNASSFSIYLTENESITFSKAPRFADVVSELKRHRAYNDDDEVEFKWHVLERDLASWTDDGICITNDSILNHVHGEVKFRDKSYFLVDGEWYHIDPLFINDLNEECTELLEQVCDDGFISKTFDLKKREHAFNSQFLIDKDCLVLDTILPDNIEACDILKYDDNNVYLIHVKKGFDNSMRELCSQINLASKRLREDLKSGYTYLKKIEHGLSKRKESRSVTSKALGQQLLPQGGLKSIFENKKFKDIVFCLAFADTSTTNRSIKKDIKKFDSNIAKYSLIELYREIKLIGFDFKVIQLKTINK